MPTPRPSTSLRRWAAASSPDSTAEGRATDLAMRRPLSLATIPPCPRKSGRSQSEWAGVNRSCYNGGPCSKGSHSSPRQTGLKRAGMGRPTPTLSGYKAITSRALHRFWRRQSVQRRRARGRSRLAAVRKRRSVHVIAGRVRLRRMASSCRSTTISSSLRSFDERAGQQAAGPAEHHATECEGHEASSVADNHPYSTHQAL